MTLGLVSSALGRVSISTPFSKTASALSASTGTIECQRARERTIEPLLEQVFDVLQRRPQLAPDGQGITLDDNIYLKKKTTPLRTPQGRQQNNSQRIRGSRHRATDSRQPPTANR